MIAFKSRAQQRMYSATRLRSHLLRHWDVANDWVTELHARDNAPCFMALQAHDTQISAATASLAYRSLILSHPFKSPRASALNYLNTEILHLRHSHQSRMNRTLRVWSHRVMRQARVAARFAARIAGRIAASELGIGAPVARRTIAS